MARVGAEFPLRIDVLHALKDIVDAYDKTSEMVVTEAIANAIDVGASTVRVKLDGAAKSISFHNDGPPMSEDQFKDYHVIARSSKSKGSGIGFAGVGAKVYLAAWDKTVIHTETIGGQEPLASDMYVDGGTLKAKYVRPSTKRRGTLYRVALSPDDYNYLEKSAAHMIAEVFGPAIDGGLRVEVNGARVRPWRQDRKLRKKMYASAKSTKLPIVLTVANEDLPVGMQGVQYHVSGKVITTKKPEWMADLRPAHIRQVHAYVDATRISDHLNLNKTAFKPTGAVAAAYKEAGRVIFEALKKEGYVKDQGIEKWEKTRLTRFFDRLFRNPEFAFLNPGARGGRGPGAGAGSGGAGGGGPGSEDDEGTGPAGQGERPAGQGERPAGQGERPAGQGERPAGQGERPAEQGGQGRRGGGGSLSLGFVNMEGDQREGWLDPSSSRVIINMEHPLFKKYESVMAARSQRIALVVTTVLLKSAASKREMGAEEVLDMQSRVLTMAKDSVW